MLFLLIIHVSEKLLFESVNSKFLIAIGLQDLAAQVVQLREEWVTLNRIVLLPTEDFLQSWSECFQVPEVLDEHIEEAVVLTILVRELKDLQLFVTRSD